MKFKDWLGKKSTTILKEYLDKNYTVEEQKKLIYLNFSGERITSLERNRAIS